MKNIMIGSSQEYQKLNNTFLLYPGYIVSLDVQHVELRIGAGYIIRIFLKKSVIGLAGKSVMGEKKKTEFL